MIESLSRRALVGAGLLLPLLALPGCESVPGMSLAQGVRQILTLSSRRVLARLEQEGGFLSDPLVRVDVPAPLASAPGQERLLAQINRAAAYGVRAARPALKRAIRELAIEDGEAIARGGPTDATDLLRSRTGQDLFLALAPAVGEGLASGDTVIVAEALQAVPSVNLEGLRLEIARQASAGIFDAMAREETAIRENPSDRALVFGSRPFLTRLGTGSRPK